MAAWWNAMPVVLQMFYLVAFLGSGLLVFQTLLILIGVEHTDALQGVGHGDGGLHSGGLEILSLRTLVAFCTGFGWVGVIVLKSGHSLLEAVVLGLVAGGLLAWSIMWLMRSMRGLASDGSMHYANAVGSVGTVVVSTQPRGAAGGQVEIMVQGRLAVLAAVGDPSQPPIAPGTKVTVLRLVDQNTLLVSPAT